MSIKYTKISPVGIDVSIQYLQEYLHAKLSATWVTSDYDSYGRVEKNQVDDGFRPEVFRTGAVGTKDYDPLSVFDDTRAAMSFFHVTSATPLENTLVDYDIDLYFMVSAKKLKPTLKHRGDQEIFRDVLALLSKQIRGFKLTDSDDGIEALDVFTLKRNDRKKMSKHPQYVFKFTLNIKISSNENNCNQ